jgi:hypothetical protein
MAQAQAHEQEEERRTRSTVTRELPLSRVDSVLSSMRYSQYFLDDKEKALTLPDTIFGSDIFVWESTNSLISRLGMGMIRLSQVANVGKILAGELYILGVYNQNFT